MNTSAFLQNLSTWEIVLIFLVILLFFGAKRLPELFRSFGKSFKEFKKATSEIEEDIRDAMEETPPKNSESQSSHNSPLDSADLSSKNNEGDKNHAEVQETEKPRD